jgi:acyl-coenzyme A synthetase/AMP-(fatty) acid ligase/thioesterase domain-containing protein
MQTEKIWQPAPAVPLDLNGPQSAQGCFEPLPPAWVDRAVADLLADVAQRFGDRVAIDDGERCLTYREAFSHVATLASCLEERTEPGQMVGLLLPWGRCFAIAALACLAARRPFMGIDLGYPQARSAEILRGAGVAAIISRAGVDLGGLRVAPGLPVIDAEMAPGDLVFPRVPGSNDDPAVVLATSGSTGRPKGIVNSTAALLQRVLQYVNSGHLTHEDRFLTLSSPCTIAGLRETLTPLLIGAGLHVLDARRVGLREVRRAICDARITIYNSVPAMLRSLVAVGSGEGTFGQLRLVRLGGDAVFWSDAALFRRNLPPGCLIQIGYSSTESTGSQWFVPEHASQDGPTVPIGYLLPGNDAVVLAEDDGPAAPGSTGALWIRSRFVTLGQWEDGRLVPGQVQPDPEHPDRRILPTGDLVRMRPTGLMELAGRIDRQVKINGQRAEPAELEAALRWSPYVADAAVLTRRSEGSTSLAAFVVPAPGAPPKLAEELRRALRPVLPSFLRPARLHVLPEIPRLPGAKPDMAALAALDAAPPPTVRRRRRTRTDRVGWAVAHAWRAALGRKPDDSAMSFEEAGGDSLRMMQFVFHMETWLGGHLPLDLFRMDMTPAHMEAAIIGREDAAPVVTHDRRPCVVLLPGLNGDEPRLAAFRAALAAHLRFAVVAYPDWPEMIRQGRDFPALVNAVADWVAVREKMDRPLLLAGYSFGGAVAAALAARLCAEGRHVAFLGILDTNATPQADPDDLPLPRASLRWTRRLIHGLTRGNWPACLAEFLAHHAAHKASTRLLPPLLRLNLGAVAGWPSVLRLSFAFHGWMRILLRLAVLRAWQAEFAANPSPLPAPVLFRSEAHPAEAPEDLGWGHACPDLRIVHVRGGHHSMLDAPNRDELCTKFLAEVRRCAALPDDAEQRIRESVR